VREPAAGYCGFPDRNCLLDCRELGIDCRFPEVYWRQDARICSCLDREDSELEQTENIRTIPLTSKSASALLVEGADSTTATPSTLSVTLLDATEH
jgi:hypothetical protein